MAERLNGTVALVTGASSGIGAAAAVALAAQGAAVALVARRKEQLDTLASRIRSQGGTALVLQADITDKKQAEGAIARTVAELGRLDTLVNNAGTMLLGNVLGAPLDEWERMVEINVLGMLYCAHSALPHLLRAAAEGPRRVADMVNISSTAGQVSARRQGRLQRDEARRERVHRSAAARGHSAARAHLAGGTGGRPNGARQPQP
jgi:NADP-dependent 3-hydroxy acid dehydrogenase YdfG